MKWIDACQLKPGLLLAKIKIKNTFQLKVDTIQLQFWQLNLMERNSS